MKRLLITAFLLLFALPSLHAQRDSSTRCFVNLHGGVGYGLYRDLGASPLTYRGLQLHPALSVSVQRQDWHYEALLCANGGGYGLRVGVNSMQAYGGHLVVGFRASRQMLVADRWQLWLGGSVDNIFDIRYNRSFGNACVGFGNFARLK